MLSREVDLLDWLRGDLSLRQLMLHIRALPPESPLWAVLRDAEKGAYKAPDLIRERQAAFEARNAARLAEESDRDH